MLRLMPKVRQTAAFVAVQRRAHGAELLGIVRRRAPAAASVRRRKPGLHPLLSPLPATRQTADVAQLSVLLGKLPGPLQLCPLICQIRAFRSFWPYAIERWTWAMESGEWPSYDVAPEWIDPPGWAMREWEGLMLARSTSPRLRWNDEGAQRFIDARQFGG